MSLLVLLQKQLDSYRKRARSLHPDKSESSDATQAYQQVQKAWETLEDSQRRTIYVSRTGQERRKNEAVTRGRAQTESLKRERRIFNEADKRGKAKLTRKRGELRPKDDAQITKTKGEGIARQTTRVRMTRESNAIRRAEKARKR